MSQATVNYNTFNEVYVIPETKPEKNFSKFQEYLMPVITLVLYLTISYLTYLVPCYSVYCVDNKSMYIQSYVLLGGLILLCLPFTVKRIYIQIGIWVACLTMLCFWFHKYFSSWDIKSVFNTGQHTTGHLPEFFLSILLLPITNSFITKRFSQNQLKRFHSWVGLMFGISIFLHMVEVMISFLVRGKPFFQTLIGFGINKPGMNPYGNLFGLIIFVLYLVVYRYAINRKVDYQLFLIIHSVLPLPIVILAFLHANSNIVHTFPAFSLYLIDLVIRIYNYSQYAKCKYSVEKNGYIRVDLYQKLQVTSGQHLQLKVIDGKLDAKSVFAHPFSVAAQISQNHYVLLIKPFGKWTKNLKNLIENDGDFKLSVSGPFGNPIFKTEFENYIFVAGGSGITSCLLPISELLHKGKNVVLIWTFNDRHSEDLTLLQDLKELGDIKIQLYYTGEGAVEGLTNGRFDPAGYFNSYSGAVYCCGPESLVQDVKKATSNSKITFACAEYTF
ncbi:hypothetical protein HDV01_004944 [Terramyces sp. JEL0728]|nr:hypothetical protein HDV01_004944 [Terramyces sp. JEL0728]